MKKTVVTLTAVLMTGSVSACGDRDDTAVPAPAPSGVASLTVPSPVGLSVSPTPPPARTSASPTKSPEPTYTDSDSGAVINFSKGYPKIVSIRKISSRVDVDTYFKDEKTAVALAPGVWTNLPDGAELQDAVADGPFIGLCASIKAFERKN